MHFLETIVREKGHIAVASKRESKPVNIYYEVYGDGPEKVILLMGLGANCQLWENQVKALVEGGKTTVLIIDNRGVGHSDAPLGFYSTKQMADDVIDVLDHFGWTSDVHLNGLSMGGMIALELASCYTSRFSTLTLTSTTASLNVSWWQKPLLVLYVSMQSSNPETLANNTMKMLYPKEWLDSQPTDPTSKYKTNRENTRERIYSQNRLSRPQTIQGRIGQVTACTAHHVSDERLIQLKNSGLPILILTGTEDTIVSTEFSNHMHSLLDCKIHRFDKGGHALIEQNKEEYEEIFHKHIEGHFKSSSAQA
ncbi:Alpha/Beta hydrolase protein [Spinellus fusiger]|nr:Alpha/Beta hydrolase protein [Spinellus fusiger]